MQFALRVLTVTVLSLLVIEKTTGAAETKPSTASVIETLRVGDHCLIGTEERIGWNRRATSSFWGTVKSRSEEQITLTNVATTGRSEHLVPIISRIPYVNRMFKNVGIGASQLAEDDVVVRVKEISSAQVIGEEQLKTVIEDAKNHQFQRVGIDFQ
jgi:hypothetical protein